MVDVPASYVSLPEGRFFLTDFFQQLNAPKVYCYLIEVCFKKHWAQSFSSDLPLLGRDANHVNQGGGVVRRDFLQKLFNFEGEKTCFLTIPQKLCFSKLFNQQRFINQSTLLEINQKLVIPKKLAFARWMAPQDRHHKKRLIIFCTTFSRSWHWRCFFLFFVAQVPASHTTKVTDVKNVAEKKNKHLANVMGCWKDLIMCSIDKLVKILESSSSRKKRRIHCQITIETGTVRGGNPQL